MGGGLFYFDCCQNFVISAQGVERFFSTEKGLAAVGLEV
jgi:hypothetical protein